MTNIAIEQALEAKYLDRIIVVLIPIKFWVLQKHTKKEALRRPSDISSDTAPAIDYMKYYIINNCEKEGWSPDLVVIIQPTSPIRSGLNDKLLNA